MSIDSVLKHILDEANTERARIIQEAKQQKDALIQEEQQEAQKLYQEIMDKEKALAEARKQRLIVNARLEQKKTLLKTKQELIDVVFEKLKTHLKENKLKKQRIFQEKVQEVPEDIDFYLRNLRLEHETEIAKILFP